MNVELKKHPMWLSAQVFISYTTIFVTLAEYSSSLNSEVLDLFCHLFPFNIRCWTFDVKCSFFSSKPPTVPWLNNNLPLMGFMIDRTKRAHRTKLIIPIAQFKVLSAYRAEYSAKELGVKLEVFTQSFGSPQGVEKIKE